MVTSFMCMLLGGFLCFIALIVYLLDRPRGNKPSVLNKKLLITWLRQMQKKGYKTIDELIEFLVPVPVNQYKPKPVPNQLKAEIIPSTKTKSIIEKNTQVTKTDISKYTTTNLSTSFKSITPQIKHHASDANLLLYLGSGLVLFAIFIFVVFNWQNFTPFIKSLILVLITLSFYTGGLITSRFKQLNQASTTFYFIGSFCLGMLGIGLWNFNKIHFYENGIRFVNYWLIYSALLITAYLITFLLQRKKTYIFLTVTALYSLFISLSFNITDDSKFRIIVLAILNLSTYILHAYTKPMDKVITLTASVVNYILDFLIFVIILSYISEPLNLQEKFIALATLLIPAIFYVVSAIRDSKKYNLVILALTLPLKIVVLTGIWQLTSITALFIFIIYLTANTLWKETTKFNPLKIVLEAINWLLYTILSITSLFWENIESENLIIIMILFVIAMNAILPYAIKKKFWALSSGLIFILPLAYRLLVIPILKNFDDVFAVNYASICIVVTTNLVNIYLNKSGLLKGRINKVMLPLMLFSSIILFLSSLPTNFNHFLITLTILISSSLSIKLLYGNSDNSIDRFLAILAQIVTNLLSVFALLSVFSGLGDINTTTTRMIACTAIAVLPAYNLLLLFKNKISYESCLTLVILPFQLLAVTMLYRFSLEQTVIIFVLYSIVKVLASEYYREKKQFTLHIISQIIFWIILLFTTFLTSSAVINEFYFNFSKLTIIFVYAVNLLLFNLPAIIYKRYETLSITINYLILTVFRILGLWVESTNTLIYLFTASLLHAGGTILYLIPNHKYHFKHCYMLLPFIILSGFSVLLTIIHGQPLYMSIAFGLIASTILIIAREFSKEKLKYLSVIMYFLSTNSLLDHIGYHTDLSIPSQLLATCMFIPALIYIFSFEFNLSKKRFLHSNLFGIVIFSLYTLFTTNDYYRFATLAILLVYTIYVYISHQYRITPYLIFALANLLFVQFASLAQYQYQEYILGFTLIGFIFSTPAGFKSISYPRIFAALGTSVLIAIGLINIFYTFKNYSLSLGISSLLVTTGLAANNKYGMRYVNLAGLALVGAIWNLFKYIEADNQLYVLILSLYMLFLSYRCYLSKNVALSLKLELGAYALFFLSLFVESISGITETDKITTGMLLIFLASLLTFIGSYRKHKSILTLGIIFIILELVVRLYQVIISLEWWMYLLIVGILMIAGAIYIFFKAYDSNSK